MGFIRGLVSAFSLMGVVVAILLCAADPGKNFGGSLLLLGLSVGALVWIWNTGGEDADWRRARDGWTNRPPVDNRVTRRMRDE